MTELERLLSQDDSCLISVASVKRALKQDSKKGNWIPVSERMPKENGNYLVTKDVYFTPDHVDDINHYRTVGISYYGTKYSWLGAEVYAWMPLPEPYEPESEET